MNELQAKAQQRGLIDLRTLTLPECLEADAHAHLRIKPASEALEACAAGIVGK